MAFCVACVTFEEGVVVVTWDVALCVAYATIEEAVMVII